MTFNVTATLTNVRGYRVKITNAANPSMIYLNQGDSSAPVDPQIYNFDTPTAVSKDITLCTITVQILGPMGVVLADGGSKVDIYTP